MDPADPTSTDPAAAREERPKRHAPRAPKKITRSYLENVALAYLGRFAATARGLEQVLMRRVNRSARHHGDDPQDGAKLIAALIARYREVGLIDDAAFAGARARTLHGQGLALKAIALRLRAKGVGRDDIDAALASLADEIDPDTRLPEDSLPRALDREAALTHARRKRLGPWRRQDRAAKRERDMAALARAGFSYSIARDVIDGPGDAENSDDDGGGAGNGGRS